MLEKDAENPPDNQIGTIDASEESRGLGVPLNKSVFVTGASGFVGRSVCQALLRSGFSVMGLVRREPPPEHRQDGVNYVIGDVTNAASLKHEFLERCSKIVHLVGIITEVRGAGQTFAAIHVHGTENVIRAAMRVSTIDKIVYVSALGASLTSASEYSRTKARAENAVRQSEIPFTILRPSIILGPGGDFVRQIEGLIKRPPLTPFPLPFVPVPGSGKNLFQPVSIDDLTACIVGSLESKESRSARILEIGGADEVSFDQLIDAFAECLGIKKRLLHIPSGLLFIAACVLEALMPEPLVTMDQLINLRTDSVCNNSDIIDAFGIRPRGFAETLATVYPS